MDGSDDDITPRRLRAERERTLREHFARNNAPLPTEAELGALDRCFERAFGVSGGQARVRRFLMAWQAEHVFGGWDPTDLWSLDDSYGGDLLAVLRMIAARPGLNPYHYGYEREIELLRERFYPGEHKSETCLRCHATVHHRCDADGYRKHLEEQRAAEERELWIEAAPKGRCVQCVCVIDRDDEGPVCRWCRDDDARAEAKP